jgi:hypothetical protein
MSVISGLLLQSSTTGRPNERRMILHNFPAGRAPLTDLLSRMQSEESNQTDIYWYEDRFPWRAATSADISSTVMFADTTTPWAAKSGNFTLDEGSNKTLAIQVADRSRMTLGDIYQFNVVTTVPSVVSVNMTVMSLPATAGRVVGVCHGRDISGSGVTVDYDYDYDTDSAGAGRTLTLVGNARGEGTAVTSGEGFWEEPVKVTNYLQTFKRTYDVSRELLKSSQDYDKEGALDEIMWKQGMFHMEDLERAAFWGQAKTTTDSDGRRLRLTGGLEYFLQEWEKANSIYRGGSGAAAITGDTSFDKRIIANASGVVTPDLFDDWGERLFSRTNSLVDVKFGYGGSTAMKVINQMLREATTYNQNADLASMDLYGTNYMGYRTPFGEIYFASHKLFNQDPTLRKQLYLLDLGYIKWRYLSDSDTKFVDNIQTKREDIRQDMWITHGGFEVHFPESHMIIKNISSVG